MAVISYDDRQLSCELRPCLICGVVRFYRPERLICQACTAKDDRK